MCFGRCLHLCKHYYNPVTQCFHYTQKFSYASSHLITPLPQLISATTALLSLASCVCVCLWFHRNKPTAFKLLCTSLAEHNFFNWSQIVARSSRCFSLYHWIIFQICYCLFIHSHISEYLGHFQFGFFFWKSCSECSCTSLCVDICFHETAH